MKNKIIPEGSVIVTRNILNDKSRLSITLTGVPTDKVSYVLEAINERWCAGDYLEYKSTGVFSINDLVKEVMEA